MHPSDRSQTNQTTHFELLQGEKKPLLIAGASSYYSKHIDNTTVTSRGARSVSCYRKQGIKTNRSDGPYEFSVFTNTIFALVIKGT